jgi:hypothetical protein
MAVMDAVREGLIEAAQLGLADMLDGLDDDLRRALDV